MSSRAGDAAGSSAVGLPDVRWIPPTSQRPSGPRRATEASEWVNVKVVVMLTLACTVLSLYDLVLLAGAG